MEEERRIASPRQHYFAKTKIMNTATATTSANAIRGINKYDHMKPRMPPRVSHMVFDCAFGAGHHHLKRDTIRESSPNCIAFVRESQVMAWSQRDLSNAAEKPIGEEELNDSGI